MKAAIFNGPNDISIQDIDRWKVPKNSQLLRVLSCSVCSYDVRVFRNGSFKVKPPIILGHEICAELTSDFWKSNQKINTNTRVSIYPIIPCTKCWYCKNKLFNLCTDLLEIGSTLNGGYAEYIVIPNRMIEIGGLIPVPDNVTNEEASLIEPLACCLNGLDQVNLSKVSSVCIIGDGPIGQIQIMLLKQKFSGMNIHVIGKISKRLQMAKKIGATKTSIFDEVYEKIDKKTISNKKENPSLIIISNNNPSTLDLALKLATKNGQVLIFSGIKNNNEKNNSFLKVDPNLIHYKQISIHGSFSSNPKNLAEAAEMVSSKKINLNSLISHKFHLKDIQNALKCAEEFDGLKSVINRF